MSARAVDWAFGNPPGGSARARLLLITLAHLADDDGRVTVSQHELQQRTGIFPRRLWSAMQALERAGWVVQTGRDVDGIPERRLAIDRTNLPPLTRESEVNIDDAPPA